MNVPLIGFVGNCKKPAARRVKRGISRKTGFILYFRSRGYDFKDWKMSREFRTSSYDPKNVGTWQEEKRAEICMVGSLLIGIIAVIFFYSLIWLVPIILTTILAGLGLGFHGIKDVGEWHALEHKACTLFSLDIEPTIENLKKIPGISAYCVSNILFSIFFFVNSVWILVMLPAESPLWKLNLISFLTISSITLIGLLIITPQSDLFFLLISLIVAPVAIPVLIAQRVMFLRKPSNEKYESTLKDIKEYMGIESQKKVV